MSNFLDNFMSGLAFGMLANNPLFGGMYCYGFGGGYSSPDIVDFGTFANPFPSVPYGNYVEQPSIFTTFSNPFPSLDFSEIGKTIWDMTTNPDSEYNKKMKEYYKNLEEYQNTKYSETKTYIPQIQFPFSSFYMPTQITMNPYITGWMGQTQTRTDDEKKGISETSKKQKKTVTSTELSNKEDNNKISYDAQALKNKWSKKQPQLTDQFYSRVVEISKKIKCNPEHLMAIMNLETRRTFSPSERNNKSSTKATGLIQFTLKTAPDYGTTIDDLAKMTAVEQLDYVEKYLVTTKKSAGYRDDEVLSSGDLYALIFQPAYAKKDVLARAGTKAYRDNKLLDMNNDNVITKGDLAEALKGFMA